MCLSSTTPTVDLEMRLDSLSVTVTTSPVLWSGRPLLKVYSLTDLQRDEETRRPTGEVRNHSSKRRTLVVKGTVDVPWYPFPLFLKDLRE